MSKIIPIDTPVKPEYKGINRLQLCITPVLNSRLLKMAKQKGVKENNIISIALDAYLTAHNY